MFQSLAGFTILPFQSEKAFWAGATPTAARRLVRGTAGLDSVTAAVSRYGASAQVVLAASLPLALGRPGVRALGRAASALALALGSVGLLRLLCPRERPASLGPGQGRLGKPGGPSFPSRHVASAVALAIPAFEAHRGIGAAMLAVSVALGVSRIHRRLHHPTDVLAGGLVGAACAWAVRPSDR